MSEIEQRLKLSTSNIIGLAGFIAVIFGGFINIKQTQTEYNQRITTLEKSRDEDKNDKEKFNLKLDKIIDNVTQIRLDNANQRVIDAESKLQK